MKSEKQIKPLDEKIVNPKAFISHLKVEDTKNSLQNLQEELLRELTRFKDQKDFHEIFDKVNKLFLKHIGKDLIEIKEKK